MLTQKMPLKIALYVLIFQATEPIDRIWSNKIPGGLWECVGADIFTKNKHILCIVDYHSKFPLIKQAKEHKADNLIKTCKIIFVEYKFPSKLMSDTCTKFISEMFQEFCRWIDIHHVFYQGSGQSEACSKFVK